MLNTLVRKSRDAWMEARLKLCDLPRKLTVTTREIVSDTRGQGTTEYAILVGVLVVIAIFSIITFKDKVQELWDQIASGISSL